MALVIVTGGSTGATDGTPVSQGTGLAPLTFSTLNTPVDIHLRAMDGSTKQFSSDTTLTLPAEVEVSFDGGSNWLGNGTNPNDAPDLFAVNYPAKMRQITAAAEASSTFSSAGTYSTDTAPSLTDSTLLAVAGNLQVTLSSVSASEDHAIAKWQYRVDGGSWVDVASTSNDFPSTVVGSLTGGQEYTFDVRAVDGSGNTSANATQTATPIPVTFSDSFTGALTDKWTVEAGTTFGITSSQLVITCPQTPNAVGIIAPKAALYGNPNDVKVSFKYIGRSGLADNANLAVFLRGSSKSFSPTSAYKFTFVSNQATKANYYLEKIVGGTPSTLVTAMTAQTIAANDVFTFEAIGTSIVVKRNGSTLMSATDSDVTSGYHYLAGFPNIDWVNAATLTVDDLAFTES